MGDVELDCDVFTVAGTDLRIVAYTAPSGSEAATKLDFLRVSAVAAIIPGADDCLPRDGHGGWRAPCSEH